MEKLAKMIKIGAYCYRECVFRVGAALVSNKNNAEWEIDMKAIMEMDGIELRTRSVFARAR